MDITTSLPMMLQLPSYPVILASLFFLFMLVKNWKKSSKLPPGPSRLPLIGNLHHLRGPSPPHHTLRDLALKHGPIMHLKLGEVSSIVISSAKAAEDVLKTHELSFAQRPRVLAVDIAGYGDKGVIFSPYGDYWRQVKKVCILELLSAKRVRSFRSVREDEVWKLCETISSSPRGRPINLSEKLFALTNSMTARAAFGNKCDDAVEFLSIVDEGGRLAGGFDLPEIFPSLSFLPLMNRMKPALEKLHQRMDNILDKIINEHKAKRKSGDESGDEDFVDVLLRLYESNELQIPLTPTNVKAIILDIFSGATESTAISIEWAMSEMLKNPRVLSKAQAEVRETFKGKERITEEDIQQLDYLKLVIKETLRVHPPVPLSARESREVCEINGFEIPNKAKVIFNRWAINRDPKTWADPDSFNPERFLGSSFDYKGTNNFEYNPFGVGSRKCPGISFGIAVLDLPVALMLYHFDWALPDGIKGEDLDMTESFGVSVKKKNALNVIATPVSTFA
ncbi:hypothetical protein RJ640_007797 [Escallonia rubra]|uniref:Cytochrome P450 n=1 Tax=Escallonia rubra TaxID=112253 RepID=A0AA88R3G1_9ASTE|nr:hypothetical protein RJ640_000442 [Escallonia rubra]KAK2975451.1 hypothetical protein RJ640_007797 [Escallonia rubra]